jgi:hypothetical protein
MRPQDSTTAKTLATISSVVASLTGHRPHRLAIMAMRPVPTTRAATLRDRKGASVHASGSLLM